MSDCNSQIINGFRPCECPLNITDVNATEFTDPLGNPVSTLGLLTFGGETYVINKVGRIEGTDWVVFGINEYIRL